MTDKFEKRVLIVEDEDGIRSLLFTVLRRRNVDVDLARDGVDAVEKLSRCNYSLILLDLMMPRMSGWQLLEYIGEKIDPEKRPIVIVMTAGFDQGNLDPRIVMSVIRKPFDLQLLTEVVLACLKSLPGAMQLESCPLPDSASIRPTS
ncbi:MAG TPA: response regulator [Thermoanaerobaculia bacterium]|nr:response regulator [Thermoanaerobaculia bacterium]